MTENSRDVSKDTPVPLHDLSMSDLKIHFQGITDPDYKSIRYFAAALSGIEHIEDPTVPTLCVTLQGGQYVMRYHPVFYRTLPKRVMGTVLAHECLHILLHHIPRFNQILQKVSTGKTKDIMVRCYPLAIDCAVNSILEKSNGFELQDDWIFPRQYKLPEERSFEYYLDKLMQKVEEKADGTLTLGDPKSDAVLNQDPTPGSHPWQLDEDEDVDDLAERMQIKVDKLKKDLDSKFKDSSPTGWDAHTEDISQYIKQNNSMKAKIFALVTNVKSLKEEYRINQLNYSRITLGLSGAGLFGVTHDLEEFNIQWWTDTSGSMGTDELAAGLGVCQALTKSDEKTRILYGEFDHQVHDKYMIEGGESVSGIITGRGGTNFTPVFQDMKKKKDHTGRPYTPDLVIIHTDGEAPPPPVHLRFSTRKTPLIWLLTSTYGTPRNPCPEYGTEMIVKM